MAKEKKIRKNDHGRGFKRTDKQWERSIADHIGKITDNSNVSQFIDAFLYGGTALLGVQVTGDIRGALIGPIGLKLASSQNIIAGGAGVAILSALGLATLDFTASPPVMPVAGECSGGYIKMINFGQIMCVKGEDVSKYEHRGWEKYSDYLARTAS